MNERMNEHIKRALEWGKKHGKAPKRDAARQEAEEARAWMLIKAADKSLHWLPVRGEAANG
jgi:hypothetical protein